MDLIYTDAEKTELGILQNFDLDFEISTKNADNTFEIKTALDTNVLDIDSFIYENGSEIGGRINSIMIDTAAKEVTLGGSTWRGILGKKIIEPAAGQAYYTVSGDANTVLAGIITKTSLGDLFSASTSSSGITISSYQFARYTDAHTGIIKMLSKNGAKLKIECKNGVAVLSAVPIVDYSTQEEMNSDMFDFKIEKTAPEANHMIGLGSGELTERLICHKYLQEDGTVGDTQFYFGADEKTAIYDYSSCESADDLEDGTTEELEKCSVEDAIEITADDIDADLGDKFLAKDMHTGISAEQYVINKIMTIDDYNVKIQYKVGEKI